MKGLPLRSGHSDGVASDRGRIDVPRGLRALYFREDIQLHSAPLTRLRSIWLLILPPNSRHVTRFGELLAHHARRAEALLAERGA
jgi:hypothetical protein